MEQTTRPSKSQLKIMSESFSFLFESSRFSRLCTVLVQDRQDGVRSRDRTLFCPYIFRLLHLRFAMTIYDPIF